MDIKQLLILFLLSLTACNKQPKIYDKYTASIKDFQYKLNREFSDVDRTPLTKKAFKNFRELEFFPIDRSYSVAAKFTVNKSPTFIEMPTTTNRLPSYKIYGEATFSLEGKELKLQVYQNVELIKKPQFKNHLFIPFTDKTNGTESYGGGRYLELEAPKGDTLLIDFNKAYNPYCAYNHNYSCPIPPRENHLPVFIRAGVKIPNLK